MKRRELVREKFLFATRCFQLAPTRPGANPVDQAHGHSHEGGADHFHVVDEKSGKTLTFKNKEELEKHLQANRSEVKVGNKEEFLKRIAEQRSGKTNASTTENQPAVASRPSTPPPAASPTAKQEKSSSHPNNSSTFVKPSPAQTSSRAQQAAVAQERGLVQPSKNFSPDSFSFFKSGLQKDLKSGEAAKANPQAFHPKDSHSTPPDSIRQTFVAAPKQEVLPEQLMEKIGEVLGFFAHSEKGSSVSTEKRVFFSGGTPFLARMNPQAQSRLLALAGLIQNSSLLSRLPAPLRGMVLSLGNVNGSLGSLFFPKSFLQRFLAGLQKFFDARGVAANIHLNPLEPEKIPEAMRKLLQKNPELQSLLSLVGLKPSAVSVSFLKQIEKSLLKFLALFLNPLSSEPFLEKVDEAALQQLGVLMMIQSSKLKKKRRSKKSKKKMIDRLTEVIETEFEENFSDSSPTFAMVEEFVKNSSEI